MLRRGIFLFIVLLISGVSFYLYQNANKRKTPQNSIIDDFKDEELTVGLALKSFILNQGEAGATLWRLNATAGNMVEEDGVLIIDQPELIYYMPPDNEELHVVSDKGDITQKTKILRFIDNVNASHKDGIMRGELLVYNGTAKTMSFPSHGTFESETIQGEADEVIWHIDTRIIEGIGQVDAHFTSSKTKLSK